MTRPSTSFAFAHSDAEHCAPFCAWLQHYCANGATHWALVADSVIRLSGLRRGLCSMIDDGLVELDQAIEIFNQEHARGVVERYKEEPEKERALAWY